MHALLTFFIWQNVMQHPLNTTWIIYTIHLLMLKIFRKIGKTMEQIALKWNDFEENVKSAFKVSVLMIDFVFIFCSYIFMIT